MRAGGAYKQMVGVHFGCAEGGVGVGTRRRPPGGAEADQRVARVIGGVNAWHLSATRRLVVFPRLRTFGAPRGGAAASAALLAAPLRPPVIFLQSHSSKPYP